ncbi:hypothetical protein CHARACLAT_012368 [Characodon lateralis]|uniref:Uncharacterized protein n=1 Tax=Characodon lateralis TaxID=208331 RepID=A0ABU7DGE7_9TELE|nr:hypothetical protein [Characodon lateralis]
MGPTEGAGRADKIRFAGGSQKSQPEGSIRDSVQTDSLNPWSTPSDPEHLQATAPGGKRVSCRQTHHGF